MGEFFPITRLALPDHHDAPAKSTKPDERPAVAINVLGELLTPEVHPGLGFVRIRASWVAVPKAAVNQDYYSPLGQHNVWLSGKTFPS